jgi:hypothetical protein
MLGQSGSIIDGPSELVVYGQVVVSLSYWLVLAFSVYLLFHFFLFGILFVSENPNTEVLLLLFQSKENRRVSFCAKGLLGSSWCLKELLGTAWCVEGVLWTPWCVEGVLGTSWCAKGVLRTVPAVPAISCKMSDLSVVNSSVIIEATPLCMVSVTKPVRANN